MFLHYPQSRCLVSACSRQGRIHLWTHSSQLTITINPSQVKGLEDYCRAFKSTDLTLRDGSNVHEKTDWEAQMLQDGILHQCKFSIRKWLKMNYTDGKPWLRPVAKPSGCHSMKYSCIFFLQMLSYFNWLGHVCLWLYLLNTWALLYLSWKQLSCLSYSLTNLH